MSYGNNGRSRGGGSQRDRKAANGGFKIPRIMRDAICSDCGKKTQVPFEPVEGRIIYCRECYPKHKAPAKNPWER